MHPLKAMVLSLLGVYLGWTTGCAHISYGGIAEAAGTGAAPGQIFTSETGTRFRVETVADGLENPWSLAFLPDGRMLVTERPGRLRLIDEQGLDPEPIGGLPTAFARGQGGLLDVVIDPAFETNRLVYLSLSRLAEGGTITSVVRGRLDGHELADIETVFASNAVVSTTKHYGSRLAFDSAGRLLITHGERGMRDMAQDPTNHAGSVIRLMPDGSVPEDNPALGPDAAPGLFTFGHRNAQGLALNPETGEMWLHEHGPRGGDEINILKPGANYGWPVVSFGREYASGRPVGEGTEMPGMEGPIHIWVPSIAPSGMAFYEGDAFPAWQGNLFVGALAGRMLVRLEVASDSVVLEERLLEGVLGRVRDVRSGPDGLIYLLTDEKEGGLYRLVPADRAEG